MMKTTLVCQSLVLALLAVACNAAEDDSPTPEPYTPPPVQQPDAALWTSPDAGSAPTIAVLQDVPKCVGTRAACTSHTSASVCGAQSCTWSSCGGGSSDCWEATNSGNDLGLCRELSAYCQVVNDYFLGWVCQRASNVSGGVPCAALPDYNTCYDAGCSWAAAPSCNGTSPACDKLAPLDCEKAAGCVVRTQREAACGFGCVCPRDAEKCGTTCVDLSSSPLNCGRCGNVCGEGASCQAGECVDADECELGTARCPEHAECRNAVPGFACVCLPGYAGSDCRDVDECATKTAGCAANATCTNTPGGATCACPSGFSGDGKSCADIDECAASICGPHATCTNSPGSHVCQCDAGYALRNGGCELVDGCQAAGMSCHNLASCLPVAGGYQCVCAAGYQGNGVSCSDVDECSTGAASCGANRTCQNNQGGYTCPCSQGYSESAGSCVVSNLCLATQGCPTNEQCISSATQFECECVIGSSLASCGQLLPIDPVVARDDYRGAGYWFRAPRAMRLVMARSRNFKRPASVGTITPSFSGSKTYYVYRLPRAPSTSTSTTIMTDMTLLATCTSSDLTPCFFSQTVAAGDLIGIVATHFDSPTDSWVSVRSQDSSSTFTIGDESVTTLPLFHRLGPSTPGPESINGLEVWSYGGVGYGAVDLMWRTP